MTPSSLKYPPPPPNLGAHGYTPSRRILGDGGDGVVPLQRTDRRGGSQRLPKALAEIPR